MRVTLRAEAEVELLEAAQHYEDRQAGLGERFLEVFVDALFAIERHPRRYARVPTWRGRQEVRRFLLIPFSYSVVYHVQDEHARIVAIAHTSRRPGYWRDRLD